jgi:hypothetical protein
MKPVSAHWPPPPIQSSRRCPARARCSQAPSLPRPVAPRGTSAGTGAPSGRLTRAQGRIRLSMLACFQRRADRALRISMGCIAKSSAGTIPIRARSCHELSDQEQRAKRPGTNAPGARGAGAEWKECEGSKSRVAAAQPCQGRAPLSRAGGAGEEHTEFHGTARP